KQMPIESERFGTVDRVFKLTVSRCLKNPKVLVFTKTEGLLDDLKKALEDLELINKGLNAYLEQVLSHMSSVTVIVTARTVSP
ncbi:MAG: dynein heavy chain, partial [Promethearchaeia archaeon]